jgi:hypothetical protein
MPMAGRPTRHRPLTRLAIAGLAGHVFFELGAGVGMPLASVIGPLPAATAWSLATCAGWRAAGSFPATRDAGFAVLNGLGMAVVAGHLGSWPRQPARLPLLAECEGMDRALMRYYNPILYLSGAAALVAALTENRAARRWVAFLPLVLAGPAGRLQHSEYRRLRDIAGRSPGWWNRRLIRTAGPREGCPGPTARPTSGRSPRSGEIHCPSAP